MASVLGPILHKFPGDLTMGLVMKRLFALITLLYALTATSCAPRHAPESESELRGSVTITRDRGLDPVIIAKFREALIDVGYKGGGEVPIEAILALFDLNPDQMAVVRRNWEKPGEVVCKGWVCRMDVEGSGMLVPPSDKLWFPVVGRPQVKLADSVLLKFRHMPDDKTIEICSINGVSVSGFTMVGATIYVDGERSSFTPVFPPSWSFPSRACDF